MGFGLIVGFIGLFDTQRVTAFLHFTITTTLVSTVTSLLPLLDNGFQQRVPELSPASATSF
jgi:hypothetical protein